MYFIVLQAHCNEINKLTSVSCVCPVIGDEFRQPLSSSCGSMRRNSLSITGQSQIVYRSLLHRINVSVRSLTIKISQWACENFCSYRENLNLVLVSCRYILVFPVCFSSFSFLANVGYAYKSNLIRHIFWSSTGFSPFKRCMFFAQ